MQVNNPYINNKQIHSNGMAIKNIKERLNLQYGYNATIDIKDSHNQYQIKICIPI